MRQYLRGSDGKTGNVVLVGHDSKVGEILEFLSLGVSDEIGLGVLMEGVCGHLVVFVVDLNRYRWVAPAACCS